VTTVTTVTDHALLRLWHRCHRVTAGKKQRRWNFQKKVGYPNGPQSVENSTGDSGATGDGTLIQMLFVQEQKSSRPNNKVLD
jgi:hypothetical protein